MSIKLLGGKAKSFSLEVPKGDSTRPTSVMLKRRIFDANQFWEGKVFVDACAGTGSMALEALSRGAQKAYGVEPNKKSFQSLKSNSDKFSERYPELGELVLSQNNIGQWLKSFKSEYLTWEDQMQKSTVLFLDPPYQLKKVYRDVISILLDESWFCGQVWIESDLQKGYAKEHWEEAVPWQKVKEFSQGSSYIIIFEC